MGESLSSFDAGGLYILHLSFAVTGQDWDAQDAHRGVPSKASLVERAATSEKPLES